MSTPLRVLIIEDSEDDALLVVRNLRRGGYDPTFERVETAEAMTAALNRQIWDILISDYSMPHFSAPAALKLLQESGIDLPFIIVSGVVGEETAVAAMKTGAHDYLIKGNLTRLVAAIERELNNAHVRQERKRAEDQLRKLSHSVEQSPVSIVITDTDGNIEYVNPKFTQLTGYSFEDVLGRNPRILKSDEHPPEFYKQLWDTITSGKVWRGEFHNRKKNGELYWEFASISPIINKDDVITNFVAVKEDITKRKLSEETLRYTLIEVEQLKNRLQAENIYLQDEIKVHHNFEEIVSHDSAFQKILRKVEQVAPTNTSVLILGETGTGKELLARAIHNLSDRKDRPLVKVDCASLSPTLIENELFGHEKGAFTGALTRKMGRFELASGGTIFLDEIGELPLDLQVKLLRVLQDKKIEPLGNPNPITVNIRVIAATNRNLKQEVKMGTFRKDLYYRLNVFPIKCPSLRDRKEDIPLLVNHFITKYNSKLGKNIKSIPINVMNSLQAYHWPGNIRELENIIERAIVLTTGSTLRLDELLDLLSISEKQSNNLQTLKENERSFILKALEECQWVINGKFGAAERLNIAPSTLRDRMKKYGIKRPS